MSSRSLDQSRQQRRPPGKFRDHYVLMRGMRAFTYASQAVKRRNAEPGGVISIGTAAHGSFIELPIHFFGNGSGFL